jgi:hypothetical protein
MTHKLTAFILAQHKKAKELAKAAEKAGGGDKKDKKKDKKEKGSKKDEEPAAAVEATPVPKKEKKDKEGKDGKVKKSSSKGELSGLSKEKEAVPENVFGISAAEEDESDSKAIGYYLDLLDVYVVEVTFR